MEHTERPPLWAIFLVISSIVAAPLAMLYVTIFIMLTLGGY